MKITRRKKKNKKAEEEYNQALWNNLKEQYEKSEVVETINEAVDVMENFINEVADDWTDTGNQEKLENKIEAVLSNTEPVYEKNLSTVKLLAAVAPLLGLLGTVIGMIETFQAITLFGTGDPKLMAGGISQALVTTMLGLIVAAPLLFMHSYAENYSKSIISFLEEKASGIVANKTKQ